MQYKNYNIEMREKLKVQLVRWPTDLPIKHPKHFTSMDDLRKICVAFRTGTAYWAPLTTAERKQVQRDITGRKERGEPDKAPHAERSDKGKKRGKQAGAKRKSAAKENPVASKCARGDAEGRGQSSHTVVYKSKELVDSDDDDDDEDDERNGKGDEDEASNESD